MVAWGTITSACNHLEKHLNSVGLFRVTSKTSDVIALREDLQDASSCEKVFEGTSPHVVAGLISLYIRELEHPLIPLDNLQFPQDAGKGCHLFIHLLNG
jgi:hypothetical protein